MEEVIVPMDIKFLIKNNWVHFQSYRQGFFVYSLRVGNVSYEFPVSLDDIGTATMQNCDKAITFMRWIRKAIEDKTLIEVK